MAQNTDNKQAMRGDNIFAEQVRADENAKELDPLKKQTPLKAPDWTFHEHFVTYIRQPLLWREVRRVVILPTPCNHPPLAPETIQ